MKRAGLTVLVLSTVSIFVGCHSDIVVTKRLKTLTRKCVYLEPIKTESPYIGQVLRDVIEKEFVRRRFEICDQNKATVLISGSAFLTERSQSDRHILGGSATSSRSIESVTLVVNDNAGERLASASYDNNERYTASKLGKELGAALADKLK